LSSRSWEIVLGGWAGTQSVIRESHQGKNLVTVKHTKNQFKNWIKLFEFKMTGKTIGLYDQKGNKIIGEVYLFCLGFFTAKFFQITSPQKFRYFTEFNRLSQLKINLSCFAVFFRVDSKISTL
jgi:hypothetical protein